MKLRAAVVLFSSLLFVPFASPKDKGKVSLPSYILRARTVAVLIDPNAGVDVRNPEANRTARKDVEAALLQWGRFDVVIDPGTADLLVVVRRGNKSGVDATVPDARQNRRPGVIDTTDNGILIGGQRGKQPNAPGQPDSSTAGSPRPRIEVDDKDDSFAVYEGQPDRQPEDALDTSPGWRYVAVDALRSHGVPAVDAFRKAVADAERANGKP